MDLDASKYGFNIIIYYIKPGYTIEKSKRLLQTVILSIMFFNKILSNVKAKYWLIKLKITYLI